MNNLMTEYRDSSSNNLLSLISGAFIGAAGLAWYLISEADKRKETKKQRAMMYSSRIQDGSEAIDTNENLKDLPIFRVLPVFSSTNSLFTAITFCLFTKNDL